MLRRAITILWPSFLVAILAEACLFALIDPGDLLHLGGGVELPPIAGYTIGFFFLWAFCAMASMLTYYLVMTPNDRQPPF